MSMNEVVKKLSQAIDKQADKAKTTAYDTPATVRRIEGDTAWVHIPGGVDETPVKMTISAKEGDQVQVRVSGGSAFMVGNGTNPPTDDARANEAYTVATVAEGAAQNALGNAARAKEAADSAQASASAAESAAGDAVIAAGDAQTAAGNAQTAADSALVNLSTVQDVVGVLNWITAHGTMTLTSDVTVNPAHVYFIVDPAGDYVVGGTHYSIVSEPKDAELSTYYELTVDESVQNYVATHIVVDTEGLWIVPDAGGNKVLIATGSGSTYTTAGTYIIQKVNGTDTVFAKFTADGATMQAEGGTQIAHLGYGVGNTQGGGTSDAPFYSIGVRATGAPDEAPSITPGNYSVAEGSGNVAYGYASHAEGHFSEAVGVCSHAEGSSTYAVGDGAHSEGTGTYANGAFSHSEGTGSKANGNSSHAEGYHATAGGDYSHAQNYQTKATSNYQTAIGKYNVEDNADTYAAIIGNGTSSARSNALTVDWSGNVEAAGGGTFGDDVSVTGDISATGDITAGGDVSDGTGNVLSNKQNKYSGYGTQVDISSYTSSNKYTIPSDGLARIQCTYRSSSYITLTVDGQQMAQLSTTGNANMAGNLITSVPVFKGQEVYIARSSTYSYATFFPFV